MDQIVDLIRQIPQLNVSVCSLCLELENSAKNRIQNEATHLCKHLSTQMDLKENEIQSFIPKFVPLIEAYEMFKENPLKFNRSWSPIL